ncbi:PACE efflux transporter [Pacificispira sp.]|uniref:PACE efflux transporter n=1 Tax=Pacificispira sp. TaxID=2888761 RepID=UPI003BAB0DB2
MSNKVALRSGKDRLRYSIAFEGTLLMVLVPVGAVFFDKGLASIGLLGVLLSLKALAVSVVYNWAFDRIDARRGRIASDRSAIGRILHAVGFEFFLVVTSLPLYCWWLDLTILQALTMDIVVTGFVVAYTYVFTLAYDRLFPVRPNAAMAG